MVEASTSGKYPTCEAVIRQPIQQTTMLRISGKDITQAIIVPAPTRARTKISPTIHSGTE